MTDESTVREKTALELSGIISDLIELKDDLENQDNNAGTLELLSEELNSLLQAKEMLEGDSVLDKMIASKKEEIHRISYDELESLSRSLWEAIHINIMYEESKLTEKQLADLKQNLEESLEALGYSELFPLVSYLDIPDNLELSHYDDKKKQVVWTSGVPGKDEQVEYRLPLAYVENGDEWEDALWHEINKRKKAKLTTAGLAHLGTDEILSSIRRVKEFEKRRGNSLIHLEQQTRPLLQRFFAYGTELIEKNDASNVLKSITLIMIGATGIKKETDTEPQNWSLDHIDKNKRLVWYHALDRGKNGAIYLDEEYCADPDAWEEKFSDNIHRLVEKRENLSK